VIIFAGFIEILGFQHGYESYMRLFGGFDYLSPGLYTFVFFSNYLTYRMILLNDSGGGICS
jgi:hypothetical protein